MPAYDCSQIITEPGKDVESVFAPPRDWQGNSHDYMLLMRERFKNPTLVQQIYFFASCLRRRISVVTGPYASEATTILNAINNRLVEKLAVEMQKAAVYTQ